MHGQSGCSNHCTYGGAAACIPAGDAWLADNVPPILDFLESHDGVLFIVWDEPEGQDVTQPFIVAGPASGSGTRARSR